MTIGTVRYLLVIEGVADQWTTDSSLTASDIGDKRRRNEGLSVEGATISEHLNMRDATTEVGSMSFRISAEDDIGLECFAQRRKHITVLTADATAAQTTLTVEKISAAAKDDFLHIGTEVVMVTTVTSNVITVTRQQWDTQQQAHYYARGDSDFNPKIYMAYDDSADVYYPPPTLENRRVYLFRYAQGESTDFKSVFNFGSATDGSVLYSDDELIYRGVITQAPELDRDGVTWALDISPVTSLLEQEIIASTEDEEFGIAGVYYSDENCLSIVTRDADNLDGGLVVPRIYKFSGYYEDDAAFIKSLNGKWDEAIATNAADLYFEFDSTNHLSVVMETHAADDCNFLIDMVSSLHGCTKDDQMWTYTASPANKALYTALATGTFYSRNCTAEDAFWFFGGWKYQFTDPGMGPKAWLGPMSITMKHYGVPGVNNLTNVRALPYEDYHDNFSTNPSYRIYVEGKIIPYVSATDALWIATDGHPNPMVLEISAITPTANVLAIDLIMPVSNSATSSIPLNQLRYNTISDPANLGDGGPYPLDGTTVIRVVKKYTTVTYLGPFVGAVIDKAIEGNKGTTPFVTGSDVNETDVTGVSFGLAYGSSFLSKRNYWFNDKVSLLEVLQEECKLLGACMKLDSTGRLTIFKLEMPASTESGFTTINTDDIITPYGSTGDWVSWTPDLEGIVNVIELQFQYNYKTGNYSKQIDIVDQESLATYKNRGRAAMQIHPYSSAIGVVATDSDDIKNVARRQLDFFSSDYDVIEIPVSTDLMTSVFCGTKVKVTSSHVPNTSNGTRGITSRPGLCIGRDWPLDATESIGKLTVRLEKGDIEGGYAPACEVTTATNVSSNIWDLTVIENRFSPTDEDDNSYFSAGYKIKVVQANDSSPDTGVGEVSTVSDATTVRVALTATAPWGATFTGNYYLVFDALSASPTSDQQDYVYIAEADGDLTGGDDAQGQRFK